MIITMMDGLIVDFYYYAHNSLSDSYISENKTSKNNVLIQYILDTTNNSYNKNHTSPMYTINLTPSLIKEIREYNKDHKAYEDDYTCTSEISNCTSDFIKKYIGKKNTTNTTETVPKYNFTGCNALSY